MKLPYKSFKNITINDVAKRANVSKATVSRYINAKGFISDELQIRISKAVEELNYKPNLLARSLKIKKTHSIGIIYPDIEDPFFTGIIKKVEDVAGKNGYTIILCNTEYDPEKEKIYIEVLKSKLVDGYIIFTTIQNSDLLMNLLKNEKAIYLDRSSNISNEIFIKLDNIESIRIAIKYLIDLGHKKIGIVMGPMKISTGTERYEGYQKVLSENKINFDKNLVKFAGDSIEVAKQKTLELLNYESKPTAVLATNNTTTIGALIAMKELKIKIPDDISIIGFGRILNNSLIEPLITTIEQPIDEFGEIAFYTLMRILKGQIIKDKTILLKPKLLVRDSCKRFI